MKRVAWLWIVTLLIPAVWFADLQGSYALASESCTTIHNWALAFIAGLSFLIIGGCGTFAWMSWRHAGGDTGADRMLAVSAVGLSVLFAIVVVAQSVPLWMLRGCL